MAQFSRPEDDISFGTWFTSPLWSKLDEGDPDDIDFIECPNSSNTTCELDMGAVSTPESGVRSLYVRTRKGAEGGNQRGLDYDLLQGGVSVQSGTVEANLTDEFTTIEIVITESVTDYSDLTLQLTSTGTTGGAGGNRRTVEISWVVFEIPDAAPPATRRIFNIS
jgi:hypothetical protein